MYRAVHRDDSCIRSGGPVALPSLSNRMLPSEFDIALEDGSAGSMHKDGTGTLVNQAGCQDLQRGRYAVPGGR